MLVDWAFNDLERNWIVLDILRRPGGVLETFKASLVEKYNNGLFLNIQTRKSAYYTQFRLNFQQSVLNIEDLSCHKHTILW